MLYVLIAQRRKARKLQHLIKLFTEPGNPNINRHGFLLFRGEQGNAMNDKITSDHLGRKAYLYIRQSSIRQVMENTESTKRQYALKKRAIALGWVSSDIIVIDSDLGQSGSSSSQRSGFKQLVSEVGMGNAGIVLGLEVSRLARNSSDWHRLLEICALTHTLILDEDGIYDPCDFNDRLLLGLKGTMSEAELHIIRARLLGGFLAKAKRGELKCPLPIGYVYDSVGHVVLDPDQQIQKSIKVFFDTFRHIQSATGTVKYFYQHQIKFPRKSGKGFNNGELIWGDLVHHRVLQLLHNPCYAGAYCIGRTKSKKMPNGYTSYIKQPREKWHSLIKDHHKGYISWEEYEQNQRILQDNSQAHGHDRRKSPPREGPALLQGLVMCGICGRRMTVRYHMVNGQQIPDYVCQRRGIEHAEPICQNINGHSIDQAIGQLLIDSFTPLALEVALQVQHELKARFQQADDLRRKQVERARYEADLARRRFMQVEPENRLVAATLEADWNSRLNELEKVQEEYEKKRKQDLRILKEEDREKILSLATDFPSLWQNPSVPIKEKKRIVRLLIEDVTLIQNGQIDIHVRFKGGRTHSLALPVPLRVWQQRKTNQDVISEIDRLLNDFTDGEIADILNHQGKVTGTHQAFTQPIVGNIRRCYDLKSRYDRLRERNYLTLNEISVKVQVSTATIKKWAKKGLIKKYRYNDKNECLYELEKKHLLAKLNEPKANSY
jgi:DNA invertase Pin-like site-specific DNA recombinase